jgi:hypothetical protein
VEDLIKLEKTGVIQGMSGSPVYIDGRLVTVPSESPKARVISMDFTRSTLEFSRER